MARKRKSRPKPVQRETLNVNPVDGVWVTSCLCDPGCCEYRCLKCGHRWQSRPRKGSCPKCEHDYFEWVNYARWCIAHRRR